jgi:hemoglobin/transferrin/lactoferrin receptor protein
MGTNCSGLRQGVALGALMLAVTPVLAQQRRSPAPPAITDQVQLDQINVQGERQAAPLLQGPTTITETRENLDRQQIQSFEELARRSEAGINFNRRTNSINIRGLDGARVLTTIDGIRIPFLTDTRIDRGGTSAFDFDALSSLDLLRGNSGSATLGGALSGAVALRTLDPADLLRGRNFGALAKTGFDSLDQAIFGSAAVAGRMGDTSVLLQGSFRTGHETDSRGELKTFGPTRTAPNPTDFDKYGFLGKIQHTVDGVHRFGLTAETYKRKDDIDTRTLQSTTGIWRPGNHRSGEEVERNRVSLSYDFKLPGAFVDEASAILYWQNIKQNARVDGTRSTTPIGYYYRDNETEQESFGFNGYVIKNFQTGPATHSLTAGLELRQSQLTQYSTGIDNCPPRPASGRFAPPFTTCNNLHSNQADTPEVDGRMVGVYVHDEIGFLANRLRVTPGVRFDWYEEKPQLTPPIRPQCLVQGAAALVERPGLLAASAGRVRLPAEADRFRAMVDGLPRARRRVSSTAPLAGRAPICASAIPTLKAEKSNGIDVGVRFGDSALGGTVTYFHTNYRNFIETVQIAPPNATYPQGGIQGPRNIPRAEIQGVELAGHYAFAEGWKVRGSFSYIRGTNRDTGRFLDSIPPMQGALAISYATTSWGAEVASRMASKRDDVNVGFKTPSYAVFDASVWWKPIQVADLQVQLGVYNIFDRRYYDATSVPVEPTARTQPIAYYSEPGRTVKATVKYQF